MLDPEQFLSPFGIRSLSKEHLDKPYTFRLGEYSSSVKYEPGESSSALFGGNSNWRGPIWFPVNYLMIYTLQTYYKYYGDSLKVPFVDHPAVTLDQIALEIAKRLLHTFEVDPSIGGKRAVFGNIDYFNSPHWIDNIPFYEYFHGDNGTGIGASHQTGWTALIASLINQYGDRLYS